MTRPTRRGYLATVCVGTATILSGCNAFGDDGDDGPRRFDSDEIETVLSEPVPDFERPAPVEPAREAVDAGLERTDDLLEAVPDSLGSDDVPNGVVRREIEDRRESALDARRDVTDAPDRFHALLATSDSRRYARNARDSFRAVEDDSIEAAVADERDALREAIPDRLAETEYAGADVHRTLLLYDRIEETLANALNGLDRRTRYREGHALRVGEVAEHVEAARAGLEIAGRLEDSHRERAERAASLEDRLESAAERGSNAVFGRDLPSAEEDPSELVDGDVSDTPAEYLLRYSRVSVDRAGERLGALRSANRVANAIRTLFRYELDARTFETIRDRVEDGEYREIEDADAVRRARAGAIERATALEIDPDASSIVADQLVRNVSWIAGVDETLQRYVEADGSAPLGREYAEYELLNRRLAALPGAADELERWLAVE